MNLEYHPATVSDLNKAVRYYNKQRTGLGNELRTEIYKTIERIIENPYRYFVVDKNIRRCLVRRFPYSILFRVVGSDTIRILVIRHHRRHPDVGLSRR
ncbi:MAG: type II toxin-antitoxin system RelE/ParE family toxin [Balneolaceae bacterium]|nr:type II toxin-antitoxin system RelE/ParE family toxin [Balneolaceae bacterium]